MARLSTLALLVAAAPVAAVRVQLEAGARELEVTSDSASDVPAHLPLCDAAVVRETCGWLSSDDAGTSLSASDIQETLSATPASAERLWSHLGFAGPATCSDLCHRVVKALGSFTVLPPSSDIGCFTVGSETICDIDLDPAVVLADSIFNGSLPDFHDKEVRAEAVAEGDDLGEEDVLPKAPSFAEAIRLSEDGIDYTVEDFLRRVANLFRIFPAEEVTVLEHAKPGSLLEGGRNNQALFQKVNYEARQYVDGAIRQLRAKKKDDVIDRWFGAGIAANVLKRSEIQRVLNSAQSMLKKVQYVYPGADCTDRTYAYVFPKGKTCFVDDADWRRCTMNTMGQFVFYMCKPVLTAGRAVQIETMTHEATHHATAYLDDIAYSRPNCTKLALEEPEKAIRNADNFCYYIQDMTDR